MVEKVALFCRPPPWIQKKEGVTMPEDKKTKYRGFTPAQAEAHKRYMKDFVEIKVRMKAEKRTIIQEHAANMGESATAFINRAIDETMKRDKTPDKE